MFSALSASLTTRAIGFAAALSAAEAALGIAWLVYVTLSSSRRWSLRNYGVDDIVCAISASTLRPIALIPGTQPYSLSLAMRSASRYAEFAGLSCGHPPR